jgi:Ni/Co efflux regulator RcnB
MKKTLLALAALAALAGPAHAESCPASIFNFAQNARCTLRQLDEDAEARREAAAEQEAAEHDPRNPAEQARRAAVRATQHGPKEIPLR